MSILNMSIPESDYGTEIQADVASSVSRLFQQRQPKESLDKIKAYAKIPSNCKALVTPKINTEIWSLLPQRVRQSDFHQYQTMQQQIGTASVLTAKIAEKLFSSNGSDWKDIRQDLLRTSLDTLTVLGNITQDINLRRKLDIKPNLNKDIASICSSSVASEWLFGENLAEQLKAAKTTSSVMKTTMLKQSYRGNRNVPYPTGTLNFRGPPRGRGGANFRSRGKPYHRRQFNQNHQN